MKQQAVLYHNASMLVQMHGAALGNMIFLPRGACIVDVVPLNNEDKHPWVIYMGQDYKPLYYNPVIIPPQKTHLMMEKINKTKEWKMLSKRQKYGQCLCLVNVAVGVLSDAVYAQVHGYAKCVYVCAIDTPCVCLIDEHHVDHERTRASISQGDGDGGCLPQASRPPRV